jgi:glycosyltransferase involved in cell wall biosynthesis
MTKKNKPTIEQMKAKPTLAFATMCKNEEHIIGTVLDAVAPYIDYLVVADNGSTDRTLEIVQEFMDRTGIPGEIHRDEWFGFDKNKNMMMEYVFDKTDYLLHLDADDILAGDFSFTAEDAGFDNYYMTMKRGTSTYKATVVYNNRLHWKFCGTAHTIIKCLEKPSYSTGDLSERGWVICDPVGSRAFDPKKYFYDAERLEKQFWDTLIEDPDGLNHRSVFYCGQSYMDYGMMEKALQWNRLYTRLANTWIEERFEAQMRVSRCLMRLDAPVQEVVAEMEKAIAIFADRAEPYYHLGMYLNQNGYHQLAYQYLTKAKGVSLEAAKKKYVLFVINSCYDLHVNDELSVSCYWTNRIEEGVNLINEIIENPIFEASKPRFLDNLNHFKNLKDRLATA